MAGTLASVLLLVFFLASILGLVTVLDRQFSLPFFNPSRQDVRDLLTALEDLVLPMGSFLSELLHSSGPSDLNHSSDFTTSQHSTTPAPGSDTHAHDGECLPPKPTLDDGGVKPLETKPLTVSTLGHSGSLATPTRTSDLPTLRNDASGPIEETPTTDREPTDGGLNSAVTLALVISPPKDHESATSANLPPGHVTGNVRLNAPTLHPLTNTTPNDVQLSDADNLSSEPFLDLSQSHQAPEHDTCITRTAVEVPLPEQIVVEIDSLGNSTNTTREEVQEVQEEEDRTGVAEEVSTEIQATEQQDGNNLAVVEEVPTESQAFEKAIRELVDPEGKSESNLENLVKQVTEMKQQRTEAEGKLESETVRFQRAERDLRNGWEDSREYFERVIDGQNEFAREIQGENYAFWVAERNLKDENERLRAELQSSSDEHRRHIARLNAQKEFAENAERTAKEEVEDRMKTQRQGYEKKIADAASQHSQEENSLRCQMRMVSDSLTTAQNQLVIAGVQHRTAISNKDRTIEKLEARIEGTEPAVAAAQEREAMNTQVLERQLKDQRTKKDGEISTLKSQLREAKLEVQVLTKSLQKAEAAVKSEKLQSQRLSDRLDEGMTTLREDKKHVVDGLKLDIAGLQRTIRDNELKIDSLEGQIIRLESGEEVRGLRSQLLASQKRSRKSAQDAKDLERRLQKSQSETEELQQAVQAQEKKSSEEAEEALKKNADVNKQLEEAASVFQKAEKLSKENEALKEQLKQAARAAEEDKKITARELEEQRNESSRKLSMAQSAEQSLRGEMERLQNERGAAAAEHERIVMEKDVEIHRLRQEHHAKAGEAVKEQEKAAAKKAATDAAEGVRLALQKQLDDERQSSRQAQEKATKTENDLRNEIDALKSQVNKVAKSQNMDPVGSQSGKEPEEAEVLFPQVDAATDAQKEAISRREIRKPRSLRQQAKPVSAVPPPAPAPSDQTGRSMGQPQQTPIKKDFRPSFADIMASVTSPRASVGATTAVAPEQAINAPVGWTNDMTETVKAMEGEDMEYIEETVKGLYGFETTDVEGLKKWLHKLQSDFRV